LKVQRFIDENGKLLCTITEPEDTLEYSVEGSSKELLVNETEEDTIKTTHSSMQVSDEEVEDGIVYKLKV